MKISRRDFNTTLLAPLIGAGMTGIHRIHGATAASTERDRFGGWKGKQFKATGFFRVEQNERWWLVTPEGNAFLSFGINHVEPDLFRQAYNREAWQKRLGVADLNDAAKFTPALRSWFLETCREYGFNTVGVHNSLPAFNRPTPAVPYLQPIVFIDIPHWRPRTELSNAGETRDNVEFLHAVVDQYYRTAKDAIRRHDPHPLILGDHQFSFATPEFPRTMWVQYPSAAEAVTAYGAYLREAAARPYIVGYNRCQVRDVVQPDGMLKQGQSALWRNSKVVEEPGHITDLLAREAVEWLGKDSAQPFFLYLAFTSPHVPLSEPEQWMGLYTNSDVDLSHQLYWAAISHLDDAVGRVVAEVDRMGQRNNTLFIFLSDNGAPGQPNRMQVKQDLESYPAVQLPGDNLPFRGKKGDVYEGGIRTPGVICWPGKLQPGVCEFPLSVTDWMPTLCALAGCTPQRDLNWDGHDILPMLTGSTTHSGSRILYGKGPRQASAVSDDHWKLIVTTKTVELFNLTEDISEANDLSAKNPDLVRQLCAKLETQSAKDNDAVPNRKVSQ